MKRRTTIFRNVFSTAAIALFAAGNVSAAVTYTIGLKVDNLSDYEAFAVNEVRCADAGGGATYGVDAGLGCAAAGFLLVDILPSAAETFQPDSDSLLLTVDKIKDSGEILGGTLKFTLVDPQTYIPLSGDLKAGNDPRFGAFDFVDLGGGMYQGSFDGCPSGPVSGCAAISNIELTFSEVPIPAAAWLFGSGLIALAGLKRRKR